MIGVLPGQQAHTKSCRRTHAALPPAHICTQDPHVHRKQKATMKHTPPLGPAFCGLHNPANQSAILVEGAATTVLLCIAPTQSGRNPGHKSKASRSSSRQLGTQERFQRQPLDHWHGNMSLYVVSPPRHDHAPQFLGAERRPPSLGPLPTGKPRSRALHFRVSLCCQLHKSTPRFPADNGRPCCCCCAGAGGTITISTRARTVRPRCDGVLRGRGIGSGSSPVHGPKHVLQLTNHEHNPKSRPKSSVTPVTTMASTA